MNNLGCFFLFGLLAITQISVADNSKREAKKADEGTSVDERLGTGILFRGLSLMHYIFPEKYACGVKRYLEALRLEDYQSIYDMGISNVGMENAFSRDLGESPCIADMADRFVRALDDLSKDSTSAMKTIGMEAGEGEFKNLKPGFAWDLAMKHADGNPRAAMFLLGLCGQQEQPSYNFKISGSRKVAILKRRKTELAARNDSYKLQLSTKDAITREANKQYVERDEQELKEMTDEISHPEREANLSLYCPHVNQLEVPRSLGAEVDIPESLKEKIIRIQRPKGDTSNLKAKYYHVIGSAYMGCLLSDCGFTIDAAGQTEKMAGAQYRAIRLCGLVKQNLKQLPVFAKAVGKRLEDPDYYQAAREFLGKEMDSFRAKELEIDAEQIAQSDRSDEDVYKMTESRRCGSKYDEEDFSFKAYACRSASYERSEVTWKKNRESRIDALLREYDASILYRRWYMGSAAQLGFDLPCSDQRKGGPTELDPQAPKCPAGWGSERCAAAIGKLATWDVDFDWTKSQHEVGARFGAQQCSKDKLKVPLEQVFCRAVEKMDSKKNEAGANKTPADNDNRAIK